MKVLIALDHSDAARNAARTAARLFGPEAELLVLNVVQVPIAAAGTAYGFGAVTPLRLDLLGEAESDQQSAIAEDAAAAGLPDAEVEVTTGEVVHEICEAAERHDVDLVVVGSHDRSLLSRLFEPSVSRGVVRTSERPVLVVPEPS